MEKRRIVVTGASRGLGRALVEAFLASGHDVVGCSRSTADRAIGDHSAGGRIDQVDVTDDAAVRRWAEAVLATGPIDLLVNNAGLINGNAPLWEVSAEEFGRVVDVNLIGTANVIRHFAPAMVQAGRGVIVNFSSTWGRSTSPEVAPYGATKWAVEGLTRALADELPPGVAAVAVNPGIIDTDMLRSCFGDAAAGYPSPDAWARKAAPFLLGLGPSDSGKPLTVPA